MSQMETPPEPAPIQAYLLEPGMVHLSLNSCKLNPIQLSDRLARNSDFALLPTQKDAWLEQIRLLQDLPCWFGGFVVFGVQHPSYGPKN